MWAVGNPGWPSPLQYTLSPVGPRSRSAVMSVDGYRCDTPNPATPRLAPSAMSATASAADITVLIGGEPSEFMQAELGVLDDPVGDERRLVGDDDGFHRRPLAPDLAGGLDQQLELGPFLVDGQRVSLDGGGEPALPGDAEPVQIDVLGGLVDAPLERVPGLELGGLGGHQAEHDDLVVGHEPERLERPRALVVVLEEEPVHVEPAEDILGDEVVGAGGEPGRLVVAAAHVNGDRHVG